MHDWMGVRVLTSSRDLERGSERQTGHLLQSIVIKASEWSDLMGNNRDRMAVHSLLGPDLRGEENLPEWWLPARLAKRQGVTKRSFATINLSMAPHKCESAK